MSNVNHTSSDQIESMRIATNVVFRAEHSPWHVNPLALSSMQVEEDLIAWLSKIEQIMEGASILGCQDIIDGCLRDRDEVQGILDELRESISEREYWKHKYEHVMPRKFLIERDYHELTFENIKLGGGGYECR